jgi:3-deoxy-manno-octulosonate cytidylyltransferase (CMP-KDO synthetase)
MTTRKDRIVGVIPARMGSSRFAGKPLAPILGLPMIEHVYRRAAMCQLLDDVYVATCDAEIFDSVQTFGGKAVMTSPLHERASDRVAEAAHGLDAEILVMVQGDEPMVAPEMIEQALAPMRGDPRIDCVNLVKRIVTEAEYLDPNTIKIVMNRKSEALYFSREPIPTRHLLRFDRLPVFKQVCIIPFRRDFLLAYSAMEPTPLEKAESIDMLRLLEHGYKVHLVETQFRTQAVDTREDLARVEEEMRQDPLVFRYVVQSAGGLKS